MLFFHLWLELDLLGSPPDLLLNFDILREAYTAAFGSILGLLNRSRNAGLLLDKLCQVVILASS